MFAGEPLTKERSETLVRRYFYLGFVGLPWLWIVNFLYFRRFQRESAVIQTYVKRSLVGGIIGLLLFAIWIVAVQLGLPSSSALWVIRPSRGENLGWQSGYFADTVYSQT